MLKRITVRENDNSVLLDTGYVTIQKSRQIYLYDNTIKTTLCKYIIQKENIFL